MIDNDRRWTNNINFMIYGFFFSWDFSSWTIKFGLVLWFTRYFHELLGFKLGFILFIFESLRATKKTFPICVDHKAKPLKRAQWKQYVFFVGGGGERNEEWGNKKKKIKHKKRGKKKKRNGKKKQKNNKNKRNENKKTGKKQNGNWNR